MKPTLPAFHQGTPARPTCAPPRCGTSSKPPACPPSRACGRWPAAAPRFINVIAIEQQHAGHAKMAGLVAAGCGSNAYLGRIIIVVDHDIDITNTAEVMWALATRWDPKTQTDIIDGCWTGYIDPTLAPGVREAATSPTAASSSTRCGRFTGRTSSPR